MAEIEIQNLQNPELVEKLARIAYEEMCEDTRSRLVEQGEVESNEEVYFLAWDALEEKERRLVRAGVWEAFNLWEMTGGETEGSVFFHE